MAPADQAATRGGAQPPAASPPHGVRRLLSTDLDGTLVFQSRVSPADREALRRWRQAGNLLVVNTGRSVAALGSALAGSGVELDFAVLYTGAVTTDASARPLEVHAMAEGVVTGVMAELGGEPGLRVFVTTLEHDYILHDGMPGATSLLTLFSPGTLADLAGRTVIGVPFQARSEVLLERVQRLAQERWGQEVCAVRNQDFVDYVPAGHSKGSGLKGLVARLTAPGGPCAGQHLETWSIGDSWNDIPMHRAADHSACLPWSPPEVKAVCETEVPSVAALVDRVLGAGA